MNISRREVFVFLRVYIFFLLLPCVASAGARNILLSELSAGVCERQSVQCGTVRSYGGESAFCGSCGEGQSCVAGRCENSCAPEQTGPGPFDALFAWLPTEFSQEDWSGSGHEVQTSLYPLSDPERAFPFMSGTDFTDKSVQISFQGGGSSASYTLSLKLMPSSFPESQTILAGDSLRLEQRGETLAVLTKGAQGEVWNVLSQSRLKSESCNYLAVSVGQEQVQTYFNGRKEVFPVAAGTTSPVSGSMTAGPWAGKLWDIRIFNRHLQDQELAATGDSCSDDLALQSPWEDYPVYLCSVYLCIWWPEGVQDTTQESFEYQVNAHDMTWEHNVLATGMYQQGNVCGELEKARDIQMSEGYRRAWVSRFSRENPWGNYVLHENFHAFQRRAGGGSKYLLESSANWGGYAMRPGTDNNSLLGMYTLQPHLPLYTTQSSPIAEGVIDAYKGGHQYGAGIFKYYLSAFIVNERLVGAVFNDARRFSAPVAAMYDFVSAAGFDMREVFADFAAKTITWDYGSKSAGWVAAEESSYRRMVRANPSDNPWPEEEIDNKISEFHDASGTAGEWVAVPSRYRPGPWAYNAFEVTPDQDGMYKVGLRTSDTNPEGTEFRGRVVVHNPVTGKRSYTPLAPVQSGQGVFAEASVKAGEKLYLVVASVPGSIFSGWDVYTYDYKIERMAPPTGLTGRDVGNVGTPGTLTEDVDTVTLTGSGRDIYGTSDSFYFAFKKLTGDGSVTAKVFSVAHTDPWAKAGVMVRNSLEADSVNAALVLSAHNRSAFQWRASPGARTPYTLEGPGAPGWIRITREGDLVTGYRSSDGQNWAYAHQISIPLAEKVYIGLVTTAHNNQAVTTAVFNRPLFTGQTEDGDANQPPVADSMSVQTDKDLAVDLTLSGSDPDGDPLAFSVTGGPDHGSLSGTAPGLVYTPDAGFTGTDQFTFKVSDGRADSAPATVSIQVQNPGEMARVFLMAGQSNMVGYGSNGEIPFIEPALSTPRSDVFAVNIIEGARAAGPLKPGYGKNSGMFGVELKAGHGLGDLYGQNVWLYKASKGGTTLDNPDHWRPLGHGGNQGNLYDQMMTGFKSFLKTTFEDQQLPYEISGFVWFQGYNDTFGTEHLYENHLRNLLASVRSELATPDLPVTIVQINDVRGAAGAVVMAAQEKVSGEDPCFSLVKTGDQRPYYHYGSYSYYKIGDRISRAIAPCLGFPGGHQDSYETAPGQSLSTGPDMGVLANDQRSLLHSGTLRAGLLSSPAHGNLTFRQDGSFDYVPAPGYSGPDSFTYRPLQGRSGQVTRVNLRVRDQGNSLALYFPFDGTGEAVLTDSASGFKARVVRPGVTFGAPGVVGDSAFFDGQGLIHYLEAYPVPGLLDLSTSRDFTWSFHMKTPGRIQGDQILLSNKYWWRRNGGGFAISAGAAGSPLQVFLSAWDPVLHRASSVTLRIQQGEVDDGNWHHVTVVASFSTGRLTVYLDGQEAGSSDISGLSGEINRFESGIGDGSYGGDGNSPAFHGWLDEIRLYNEAKAPAGKIAVTENPL